MPLSLPVGPLDPSRSFGRASRLLLALQEGLPAPPNPLGWPIDFSRPSRKASRLLLSLREGL